jgi:hypothetical protein
MLHTAASVKSLLLTNSKAVHRAVLALTKFQTSDEVASLTTRHDNKVGFNAPDARSLTALALKLAAGGYSTGDELAEARKRCLKYSAQLARLANANEAAKAAAAA